MENEMLGDGAQNMTRSSESGGKHGEVVNQVDLLGNHMAAHVILVIVFLTLLCNNNKVRCLPVLPFKGFFSLTIYFSSLKLINYKDLNM